MMYDVISHSVPSNIKILSSSRTASRLTREGVELASRKSGTTFLWVNDLNMLRKRVV